MNRYLQKILESCEPGTTCTTEYINAKTAITLKCTNGHIRSIIPSNLTTRGNGKVCRECAGLHVAGAKSNDTFEKEVTTKYPHVVKVSGYTWAKSVVELMCTNGHVWEAIASNLLSRSSDGTCPECTRRTSHNKHTLESINARVKVHYPNLTVLQYDDMYGTVLDSTCGKTSETGLTNISMGRPWVCQHCTPHTHGRSVMEIAVEDFIRSNYTGWVVTSDRTILEGQELDIVLPDLGLAIEFDGTYYHREETKGRHYHRNKTELVEAFGYQLIHLYDIEWINCRKIVESRILGMLGKVTPINARDCDIRVIDYPRDFLNANHLQGCGSISSVNYGLFYNEELVSVMTFSRSKFKTKQYAEYELVRFCTKLNHRVRGGASKLLKKFTTEVSNSVFSFSNKRWGTGAVYKQLGFTLHHSSDPGYDYVKGTTLLSRYSNTKAHLVERCKDKPWFTAEMTEEEIASNLGMYKIYDCGTDVWVLNK